MKNFSLPVRFTANHGSGHTFVNLEIAPKRTAFVLVDANGDCGEECNLIIQENIAPALQASRSVGIRGIFIYGDDWLPDGPHSRATEYHRTRRGHEPNSEDWRPHQPVWADCIQPLENDPLIAKKAQNAFVGTYLDLYLRGWGIDTLLMTGFSFKACLFYTIIGAFERNYRVIFLRDGTDPPGTNEHQDTVNPTLESGGWTRHVLTRQIEDHLGYSSTCKTLIESIKKII